MLHGGFFIHLFSQWYLHVYIWHIVIRIEICNSYRNFNESQLLPNLFENLERRNFKRFLYRKKSKPYQTTSRLVSVQTGMKW